MHLADGIESWMVILLHNTAAFGCSCPAHLFQVVLMNKYVTHHPGRFGIGSIRCNAMFIPNPARWCHPDGIEINYKPLSTHLLLACTFGRAILTVIWLRLQMRAPAALTILLFSACPYMHTFLNLFRCWTWNAPESGEHAETENAICKYL